jgi:broad specificity phosphatase PhoE
MELALIARHGQSVLNVQGVVNGDPSRDLGLSDLGREEALGLGRQIAGVPVDFCITSQFRRAIETANIALGRDVSLVDGGLDDIRIGELEGQTLADYRAWKHEHTRDDAFPGGESLNGAARRYADAFERVLERTEATILVVCHEIPVRYLVNAAGGSDDLDGPLHDVANASPYVFDGDALRRGIEQMRTLAEHGQGA